MQWKLLLAKLISPEVTFLLAIFYKSPMVFHWEDFWNSVSIRNVCCLFAQYLIENTVIVSYFLIHSKFQDREFSSGLMSSIRHHFWRNGYKWYTNVYANANFSDVFRICNRRLLSNRIWPGIPTYLMDRMNVPLVEVEVWVILTLGPHAAICSSPPAGIPLYSNSSRQTVGSTKFLL